MAFFKMRRIRVSRLLPLLFFLSVFLALLITILFLVRVTLDQEDTLYIGLMINSSIPSFFVILLLTLVTRLHVTFAKSAFAMSKCKMFLFLIIFLLQFACILILNLVNLLNKDESIIYQNVNWIVPSLFSLSFFVGGIIAVHFLVDNLSKMIQIRARSVIDVMAKVGDISLDSNQQNLIALSSKYILLFCIAMCSTILINIVIGILFQDSDTGISGIHCGTASKGFNAHLIPRYDAGDCSHRIGFFYSFDYVFNLLCLYWQFAFAVDEYVCFCGCLHRMCIGIWSERSRKSIHRLSAGNQSAPRKPPQTSSPEPTNTNIEDNQDIEIKYID